MVNCAEGDAFNTPDASMVKVFISVVLGKVGEKRVVDASGMMMFLSDDGPTLGVQFSTLVHESDNEPFQVKVVVLLYSSRVIFLVPSQLDEKKATLTFDKETQLSTEL
jgi:hypothetical protein